MPFLRRRGNMASDQGFRQQNNLASRDPSHESNSPRPSEQTDQDTSPNGESRASSVSRPESPPVQEESNRHKRFSILRFRNASDSQLSIRARQQSEKPPPVPRRELPDLPQRVTSHIVRHANHRAAPEIITTAPTGEFAGPKKKTSYMNLVPKIRRSHDIPRGDDSSTRPSLSRRSTRKSFHEESGGSSLALIDEPPPPAIPKQFTAAANGATTPAQAGRQSESSRSEGSSLDRQSHPSPMTTPKKSPATNPFFRLRRTKKPPEPMFPLSHLPQKNATPPAGASSTSLAAAQTPRPPSVHSNRISRSNTQKSDHGHAYNSSSPAAALFPRASSRSGQSSPTRAAYARERSSTVSSVGRDSSDDHRQATNASSTSFTGRKSFGDLFGLSRLRQNPELSRQGSLTPATPGSTGSKNNSFQLNRDAITLPERRDDESPAKYLARIEEILSRGAVAAVLSKNADAFSTAVLRSYMRSFSFFGDPMDMAIRKLLMEAELPKETQQIDRCLQAFANRYHECNPGIYSSPDQAYFIAFSLLILHTDVFNKNNKYKMQKPDYLKNTAGEGIYDDILECFYDNITYTPFIHVEDEVDLSSSRHSSKSKRLQLMSTASNDPAKRAAKEPIDPYTLLMEGNLEALRPNLKDAMPLEEHYNYLGSAATLNLKDLQKTFFRTGVLQIVSARSRPDAFMSAQTASNPAEAHVGIVDIKVTKVGLLWRKDTKKRKTRSPWQEWGAILTGAQLYFFRNTSWVKNLMHQYESHLKAGHDGIPIIFNPPIAEFKPDDLMSTNGAVALHDLDYKKHKNAFVYVRHGGADEVLLADDEDEMNDWLAKLNYAAAFRTSGVRMRGVIGGNYDGQGRRGIRRLDSSEATQLVDTPTGQVSIVRGNIDQKMVDDIQAARRDVMQQKIKEMTEKELSLVKQLDEQLRNARHLQILAPIQPRTRDHLLEAAGRISAQLKWSRMQIWKEKCHRDILKQDLEEDMPGSSSSTGTPIKSHASLSSRERAPSPSPKSTIVRNESTSKVPIDAERKIRLPAELHLPTISSTSESITSLESPDTQGFQTPPQSASDIRHSVIGPPPQEILGSDSPRPGSTSSAVTSPTQTLDQTPQPKKYELRDVPEDTSSARLRQSQDDIDAEERNFLKQAGLLESKLQRDPSDKATISTVGDGVDQTTMSERERDKNKIRRSLQRTLREGAGHLSNHRSRRERDTGPPSSSEGDRRESMLARGSGSFVVHGKKASVIDLGTDFQGLSNEEKLRSRKMSHHPDQPPVSPTFSNGGDDDFYSAVNVPIGSGEHRERRESAASASTATARSFRDLHRRYSTAQAARSTSASGRLAIPSDGESEIALSLSDGRRSPLPPIDPDEAEEEELTDEDTRKRDEARETLQWKKDVGSKDVSDGDEPTKRGPRQDADHATKTSVPVMSA